MGTSHVGDNKVGGGAGGGGGGRGGRSGASGGLGNCVALFREC